MTLNDIMIFRLIKLPAIYKRVPKQLYIEALKNLAGLALDADECSMILDILDHKALFKLGFAFSSGRLVQITDNG